MADINTIQNDMSIGDANQPTEQPASLGVYLPPTPTTQIDSVVQSSSNSAALSFPSDTPKYYFKLDFYNYSRKNLMEVGQLKGPIGSVVLPVPMQIVNPTTLLWDQEALGLGPGGLLQGVSSAVNDATDTFINLAKGRLTEAQNGMNNLPGSLATAGIATAAIAAQVGSGLGQAIPGTQGVSAAAAGVTRGAMSLFGISPNQFVTIVFKGPTYKQLQFSWKLMPRNQKESEVIKNICKLVNDKASPTTTLGALLWKFPSIVQMSFSPNADYLFKFKPAVIQSFVSNYTPGGMPAFYKGSGAPEAVDISLRTLELEYWLDGQH